MQSSPKKELHSVNKCVHRIALVHSNVSFKVVDIESEDELLRTIPSPSPLILLKRTFGTEVSNALHELNISDGRLELSGYFLLLAITLLIRPSRMSILTHGSFAKGQFINCLISWPIVFNSGIQGRLLMGLKIAK